ncbi:cyclic nucleotide-gated ion channel 1-like isoform X3 [Quercus lobata]|uniref:cyclic nucleotide-gated ion channel 1-like isoform X3 n=1 Tax=Quercus lobata TaxID=97700 RepID=UPI0012493BD2|nr:cyclic nucleotide-gated ion channel 1-like isoform X3 [Quercus lobata]
MENKLLSCVAFVTLLSLAYIWCSTPVFMFRNKDIERQPLKEGEGDSSAKIMTTKTIFDPQGKFLRRWNVIFVLSCVIAVSVDPLFCYLPMINIKKYCIDLDKKLLITTIVLRSINDIIYLMHIMLQFRTGFVDENLRKVGKNVLNTNAMAIARRYLKSYFVFDILVILPIPQVAISSIISEMRRMTSSYNIVMLNCAVIFQYVPRILQIFRSWKELIRSDEKFEENIWFKAALNFFLYLLAGHVLGAFWYFFSFQRMMDCWHSSCEIQSGCVQTYFNCDNSRGNFSFSNDFCDISTPDTQFNFGIYLEALQSGVVESRQVLGKIFYGFWWGMQNLSLLGQNLKTSAYVWDNFFSVYISVMRLFLFLYFLGNLQLAITRSEELRMKMKSEKRKKQKEKIELWSSKHDLPSDLRGPIMDNMIQKFKEDEDVYVENLLLNLPGELQNNVKQHICLKLLENEHSYVIREGDPIFAIFFITNGIAWTYTTGNNGRGVLPTHAERLVEGQFFGGELLEWLRKSTSTSRNNLSKLPISSKTLKTHTKVEAFALMADDLTKIWSYMLSRDSEPLQFEAASIIQRAWRVRRSKMGDAIGTSGQIQSSRA